MSRVRRAVELPGISATAAYDLWTDTTRWATFIDGFKHVDRLEATWPQEGAKVVWRSGPAGRGTVTERVTTNEPGRRFATQVLEERVTGTQTVLFSDGEVAVEFEYALVRGGPAGKLVDALFIRRAQAEAIQRTLTRFKREAL
jgi:uncharacterized membrane protein